MTFANAHVCAEVRAKANVRTLGGQQVDGMNTNHIFAASFAAYVIEHRRRPAGVSFSGMINKCVTLFRDMTTVGVLAG